MKATIMNVYLRLQCRKQVKFSRCLGHSIHTFRHGLHHRLIHILITNKQIARIKMKTLVGVSALVFIE